LERPSSTAVTGDVARALEEDIRDGDRTAALIPPENSLQTRLICREAAVLAGQAWFEETFRQLHPDISVDWFANDGESISTNQEICSITGNARALLSGERTAINFLQTLSGTATQARRYVDAVKGTGVIILDTRKTLPGLRLAQKYAVRCGGARNHRVGLFDAILVKENHISAAGSIGAAVKAALDLYPDLLLEVEVENLEQLEQAHASGAQRVLLDNFSNSQLRAAVERFKGKIGLEASGGISLDTIRETALTGVDFISVGDLTKSVRATDFSMRFI
jgi:nicotinate-nucleotide pyrophosphorylase (carboxylating)